MPAVSAFGRKALNSCYKTSHLEELQHSHVHVFHFLLIIFEVSVFWDRLKSQRFWRRCIRLHKLHSPWNGQSKWQVELSELCFASRTPDGKLNLGNRLLASLTISCQHEISAFVIFSKCTSWGTKYLIIVLILPNRTWGQILYWVQQRICFYIIKLPKAI